MALYLTAKDTGERVRLCLLPDEMKSADAPGLVRLSMLKSGEARYPMGTEPTAYSWSGVLPGASRKQLDGWRAEGNRAGSARVPRAGGAALFDDHRDRSGGGCVH